MIVREVSLRLCSMNRFECGLGSGEVVEVSVGDFGLVLSSVMSVSCLLMGKLRALGDERVVAIWNPIEDVLF